MINFDTNKLFIVTYPRGAGGKFLINALGLADNAVLQSHRLAELQLSGNLSQKDKIDYLSHRLSLIDTKWDDLCLGNEGLFGVPNGAYFSTTNPISNAPIIGFHPVIDRLSNSNSHYFFMVTHWAQMTYVLMSVWKRDNLIVLENSDGFINYYNRLDTMIYPFGAEETSAINDSMNIFKTSFISELTIWDTEWYRSKELTITNIRTLYEKFGLTNYNEEAISNYYEQWISVLNRLKENHENRT